MTKRSLFKYATVLIFFSLLNCALFSQQYYFDDPKDVSKAGTINKYIKTIDFTDKKNNSIVFWEEIEKDTDDIYISAMTNSLDGWSLKEKIYGPIKFSDEIPDIYSVAANRKGVVLLAAISETGRLSVLTLDENLSLKNEFTFQNQEIGLTAPRIYKNSKDGFTLFVSIAQNDTFNILYSKSSDGKTWSQLIPFEPAQNISNAFNPIVPVLCSASGTDFVIFQAQYTYSNLISIQLYLTYEKDKGKSWTPPVILTGEKSVNPGENFYSFNNQSASLLNVSDRLYIAWERSPFNTGNSNIYFAELSKDGKINSLPEKISETSYSFRPKLFYYSNSINLLWFSSVAERKNIYLANKTGSWWSDAEVLSSSFAQFPNVSADPNKDDISFFWENTKNNAITVLNTDHYTAPPLITAQGYDAAKKYRTQKASAKVSVTQDSSGVKGYSWIWTQDKNEVPPKQIMRLSEDAFITGSAGKDGIWYFKARQTDYAGNWSETVSIPYLYDSTPPNKVSLNDIETDENSLAVSNTFAFTWEPDPKDLDIAGYTYALEFIDSIPRKMASSRRHPTKLSNEEIQELVEDIYKRNDKNLDRDAKCPKYILTKEPQAKIQNIKNGLYIFTVCAIDEVGNISQCETKEFIFNKYNPVTYITDVKSEINKYGDVSIEIIGGGFTYDGTVSKIYIDLDGFEPYDITLTANDKNYSVMSDNTITDIQLKNIKSGSYKIGLLHTDRGLYFTRENILEIKEFGTVKQKIKYIFEPAWKAVTDTAKKHINITTIELAILITLSLIGIAASLRNLLNAAKETAAVQQEVNALLKGDIMPQERKHKSDFYKNKGLGLKTKLILHSTILITVMDIFIFILFGIFIIRTQESTLTDSLNERVNVMIDSVASGSKIYLPQTTSQDNLSLTDIANQTGSLKESLWTTIIGTPEDSNSTDLNAVWATTDKEIGKKIDTESFIPGVSRLNIEFLSQITESTSALNKKCREEAHDISLNISELTNEALSLISKTDEKSIRRRQEIQGIRTQLVNRLDTILSDIADQGSGTISDFTRENINSKTDSFLFYKPLIYRQGNDQNYVHGIVLMNVSTEFLIEAVNRQKRTILITSAIILILVITLSFISTYIISSSFIKPINKIVKHVEMIRDTEDKENLAGKDIIVTSKDELGVLGDTVNDMTHGLVEAAVQSKNLTFGKEVQTKFIPLQTDENGNTLTTGKLEAKGAEFFSYYAGADDLSGDYFDYKQLDKNHFAIIKCDVSGHGVPAALIMVEVATLFLNYFDHWDMNNPNQGYNLVPVVGQINNLLESRGFKGRFAAFTLCIMNIETGVCHFCNAGDNLIHVYDSRTKKKRTVILQETPAAGMFSTDLIDMKGGYKVSEIKLKKDDVLLLYTDGIEEAKRNFRDENLNPATCDEESVKEGETHETHAKGESSEEMTPERVTEIIEAVYANKKYVLHKWHHPQEQNDLIFDFTNSPATAEEAIMALVSIEKIFRMYKPVEPKTTDKVKCDKKIDSFLRQHFVQYSKFCSNKSEIETDPAHIYYHGVAEDPQYDDLTLIAIKKN